MTPCPALLGRPPHSHPREAELSPPGRRATSSVEGNPLAAISHPRPDPGPHLEAAAAPSADGRAPPVHHHHVLGRRARRAAPARRGLRRRLRIRVGPAVQVAQHHLQSPHRAARPDRPLHPARYRGPQPKDRRQRNRERNLCPLSLNTAHCPPPCG